MNYINSNSIDKFRLVVIVIAILACLFDWRFFFGKNAAVFHLKNKINGAQENVI